jgi:uridine kinase
VIFNWRELPLADLVHRIEELAGAARPAVIGLNGHSSSGKTTLGRQLAAALPGGAVLHTDDLAWHQGVFSWDSLLINDVLPVVRAGAALSFRPPAWVVRRREGAIELPSDLHYLILEGVGSTQASVRAELAVAIWVETDEPTRLARDAERVAAGEISTASYEGWMAEENAYVTAHRPWEDADLVINGGDALHGDRHREVVIAEGWRKLRT